MPVHVLSDADRERLTRFPRDMAADDLITFFTLSPSDLAEVGKQRGGQNRLGFAFQLCALRYLGFSPDDLTTAPPPLVSYVACQIGVAPSALKGEH